LKNAKSAIKTTPWSPLLRLIGVGFLSRPCVKSSFGALKSPLPPFAKGGICGSALYLGSTVFSLKTYPCQGVGK